MIDPALPQTDVPREARLLQLGRMVDAGEAMPALLAALGALDAPPAGEGPGEDAAFNQLRAALALSDAASLCVALWLWKSWQGQALPVARLLWHCRRLGGEGDIEALSPLFMAQNGQAVLHPVAQSFLAGSIPMVEGAGWRTDDEATPLLQDESFFEEMCLLLERWLGQAAPAPLALALRGPAGGGRRFLFTRLAARFGRPLLVVEDPAAAQDAALAAALVGAMVCLVASPKGWQPAAEQLAEGLGLVLLAAEEDGPLLPAGSPPALLERTLPPLDIDRQAAAVTHLMGDIPFPGGFSPRDALAGRRFTLGQLAALAGRLRAEATAAGGAVDAAHFQQALRGVSLTAVRGAEELQAAGTLQDLILPEAQRRELQNICGFVRRRQLVQNQWGFGGNSPYGRGISVLFYGAPGTGKTMAATVVAGETGLPLLLVDLAQLISKYIGETQKNIGQVFDDAGKADCILFFDEADALFSRRTDAGDSQDKYANAEIAYLLQRTEQYDGVCLLATNLLQNFDEAFRRRITHMLHFPFPDAALRLAIWQRVFPKAAPVQGLDYEFLAQDLELSGAGIKSCATHAAYLAALYDTPITMAQVLAAAKQEYAKLGRSFSAQAAQRLAETRFQDTSR